MFAASLRTELTEYEYMYEQLNKETHEFSVMQTLFDGYLKNGNAEKFYGKFYAQVPLNAANFFQGLSRNSATLLATKVANSMLTYCKNMMSPTDDSPSSHTALSEKEKAGLQYIYRLTHSASELSGFTCTSSLTMTDKFQYRTRPPSAVLKNFDNSLAECVNLFIIQIE